MTFRANGQDGQDEPQDGREGERGTGQQDGQAGGWVDRQMRKQVSLDLEIRVLWG